MENEYSRQRNINVILSDENLVFAKVNKRLVTSYPLSIKRRDNSSPAEPQKDKAPIKLHGAAIKSSERCIDHFEDILDCRTLKPYINLTRARF